MATSPEPSPGQNDTINEQGDIASFSYFLKTVVLRDWWLVRSQNDLEGKSVCVSGYASTKKEAQRMFNSAPIVKRHDVFTLETVDGIYIMLHGFINKTRTLQSGFSSELFDKFVFGFPPDWDECVEKFSESAAAEDISLSSLSKNYTISEDHSDVDARRDCSRIFSENCDDGASEGKCVDHAAISSYSGREEMNGPNNSIPISPADKLISTVKNIVSENIASTSGCHMTSVNSTEDRNIVLAITSSHFEETEVRRKTAVKSKAKKSPCAEGVERSKDESAECAELNIPDEGKLNSSTYDKSVSVGTSGIIVTVYPNKPKTSEKKQQECETDKGVFGVVDRNFSDVTSIQCNKKAVVGYNDQNKETTEAVGEISAPGDSIAVTPPSLERNAVNPVPRNSKSRKSTKLSSKMDNRGKSKRISGCSTKKTGKQRKPSETPNSSPRINVPEAMKRAASRLRSVERNSNTEEKKEQKVTSKTCSSKKARRKISFDAQESPATENREVKTSIQSPESLSLKRSRSGRLLLPVLDFWRNQIPVYDADRNITGIQEEIVAKSSKGSKKKQKQRL